MFKFMLDILVSCEPNIVPVQNHKFGESLKYVILRPPSLRGWKLSHLEDVSTRDMCNVWQCVAMMCVRPSILSYCLGAGWSSWYPHCPFEANSGAAGVTRVFFGTVIYSPNPAGSVSYTLCSLTDIRMFSALYIFMWRQLRSILLSCVYVQKDLFTKSQ